MRLNRENLGIIGNTGKIAVPDETAFLLPEKVLQFGTGVLLRGLPEYFINEANREGKFNGRVVIVKSTAKGDTRDFKDQDCLYTIGVRGIDKGAKVEQNIICSAVSRVIDAHGNWDEVLNVARSKDLEIIISNTTEVGIQLTDDNIQVSPPVSFPGKLLAVLYERYRYFHGDKNRGLIIIPTELISDNGAILKEIVVKLAEQNELGYMFLQWLVDCNTFSNSLVDRIVPGKPDKETLQAIEHELGYEDELLIVAEVYKLWAIEANDEVKQSLSFAGPESGVFITPDISVFKELKLRLLNGSHTLGCGIAMLSGFDTVYDAMRDCDFTDFVSLLLHEDLARAIPYSVDYDEAIEFSERVLDRFRNPYIKHYWSSISSNYTLKLKLRVVPVLLRYYDNFNSVPQHIAFGFAAYLLLMRTNEKGDGFYFEIDDRQHKVEDENARYFSDTWLTAESTNDFVNQVFSNSAVWDANLSDLPGFADAVTRHIEAIEKMGVTEVIKNFNTKRIHFNEAE